jgi:hypothetical protein
VFDHRALWNEGLLAETREHYQVSFAVLALAALAYSLLQSLVIPALAH